MDTGVIIAIVVGALILLALLALIARRGRDRRHETRRHEAREIRQDAEVSSAQADRTRAEAEERAARARQEEASAREQAAAAERQHHDARERHLEAARRDPDMDEDAEAERFDREHAERTRPVGDQAAGDRESERVEHYERTETPGEERERRFVQDDSGEVVQDEERREPRR